MQNLTLTFKPDMLAPAGGVGEVAGLVDTFGNPFGYSTMSQGPNPTFYLWSTAGGTTGSKEDRDKWAKNW